ncbi:hypothetical protein [Mesotoga sp. H07.pep.5.3]|uniref:hypothetical protein n=1 Tax=Mesotoga sp. H07.pep.5.3 TaxID=1421003 RepID=UPI000C17B0B2|nr:hypothetical protein [Mesotoga sp. H07.pep.5.3]PIJ60802.1 hypothetical protein V513_13050 [Mesotoga sp. H07.pep.5.3]
MDDFKPRVLRRAEMEKELEKLLNVEAEIRSDSYLLTFYFPMENMTRADAERHVKSFILEHLRKDEKLSGMGKINQRIVEAVLTGLGNTKELRRGLAIFVEFRMGEDVKADEVIEGLSIIPLSQVPEKEIYIGKTFDLDQLIWLSSSSIDALIVSLEREKSSFYAMDGNKLSLIKSIENEFIRKKEQEYIEEYSPSPSSGAMYHGNASEKVGRAKEEENRRFLQKIASLIKNDEDLPKDVNYLVIYYSSSFNETMEKFKNEARQLLPYAYPVFVQKTLNQEKQLQEDASKLIESESRKIRREFLHNAKENFEKYVEGWTEVSKAANDRRIDTLFINPTERKRGYVLGRELVYTHAVKDSREVRNVGPWIVRSVVNNDGKVVVVDKELLDCEIAARLRY